MLMQLASPLLAALMLASSGSLGAVYLCAADGQMHDSCCCRSAADDEAERPVELEAASRACCELRYGRSELPEATASADARIDVPPAAPMRAHAGLDPAFEQEPRAAVATLLPRAGPAPPPLYLQHCAFLI